MIKCKVKKILISLASGLGLLNCIRVIKLRWLNQGWIFFNKKSSWAELDRGNVPDGYRLSYRFVGGERYELIKIGELNIYFHASVFWDKRGIGRHARELAAALRKFSSLDRENGCDLSVDYFFFSTIHWCPKSLPTNSVVLIHDIIPLLFPDMFGLTSIEIKKKCELVISQAKMILTISDSARKDIVEYFGLSDYSVGVVMNGVSEFSEEAMPSVDIPESDYFVFLGTADRHKNLDVVLDGISANPDLRIVLIGDRQSFSPLISKYISRSPGSIYVAGRLSDAEIVYVLKRSLGLVFPSLYEGFGLPPLEAALLGVPSICSSRPAMIETLKDATFFVDPHSPQDWAEAMLRFRNESELRATIADAAKAKAKELTWEKSASKLLDILSGLRH